MGKTKEQNTGELKLADRKRLSILAAAVTEFQKNGFAGTSMDRIAETAEVSKRTVYNHFPSKDDLFEAIVDGLGEQMGSMVNRPFQIAVPLQTQMQAIAKDMLDLMTSECFSKLARVVISRFIESPELAARTIAQQPEFAAVLTRWIRDASKQGELSVKSVDTAVKSIQVTLNGRSVLAAVNHRPTSLNQSSTDSCGQGSRRDVPKATTGSTKPTVVPRALQRETPVPEAGAFGSNCKTRS